MAWPTPQDYNEAIQNPRLAFRDPELQQGQPELTPQGLPRPITGGFATVYKLQCQQRTWVVRCFLRPFHDHERRYAAISDHLDRVRLPYMVGFTFLREGIRVRGQWYPILKMEWVQGEQLHTFIEKHLLDSGSLLSLARRWVEMVKALRDASIAHGDLQHGNVLVTTNGQLRLVDYDGMYVPALSGEGSHEVGHRNYQHPLRTESDFGPYLDNFSAWVIYVSLIALAADPGLWKQFAGGDESLLFRRRDFEQPEASDVLRALESHRDDRIRSAATLFKSLLYLGPRDVPSLDGQIAPITLPPTAAATGRGSWIEDYVRPHPDAPALSTEQLGPRGETLTVPTPSDPSWILDALMPSHGAAVSFRNSVAPERAMFAVSTILIPALFLALSGADFWPVSVLSVILLNLALWVYRYHSDVSVRELRDLTLKVHEIEHSIRAAEIDIRAAERQREAVRKYAAKEEARLEKEQKTLEAEEKKEIDACQAKLQSDLSSINTRRRASNQQQAEALQKIRNDIGAKVADLNRQIASLNQAEADELTRALQATQQQHIAAHLRRFSLEHATIPGIGPAFKARLMRSGFHTAADVEFYRVQHVHGIGPARARSLANWRSSLEAQARKTMPSALSPSEVSTIRSKYEGLRRTLEQQRDWEQERQKKEEENVRAQYRPLLDRLDQEEKAANAKTQVAISEVRARYAQRYQAIRDRGSKLAHDTASKLREIDGKIGEARKKLFGLHWEKEKLRRQLKPYVGIRFRKYVKRVFMDSRAA
ncbi:MAG: hypothetical protein AA908_09760 [Chlorobi bacterium NICIL-2]|nr:MAG: hypothetical protein AA908_09760 [Chlorobi bacterium NICIL-2]